MTEQPPAWEPRDMERAARAYGFVTMPDPITLFPRQMEIIENVAAALATERQEAIEECARICDQYTRTLSGTSPRSEAMLDTAETLAACIRALAAAPGAPESLQQGQVLQPYSGTIWRHKKRGTLYTFVGVADVQVTDCILEDHRVVIYRDNQNGKLWVRPTDEFYDGRFEQLPPGASEPEASDG